MLEVSIDGAEGRGIFLVGSSPNFALVIKTPQPRESDLGEGWEAESHTVQAGGEIALGLTHVYSGSGSRWQLQRGFGSIRQDFGCNTRHNNDGLYDTLRFSDARALLSTRGLSIVRRVHCGSVSQAADFMAQSPSLPR